MSQTRRNEKAIQLLSFVENLLKELVNLRRYNLSINSKFVGFTHKSLANQPFRMHLGKYRMFS